MPDHRITAKRTGGWGGTYRSACSCGWSSTTYTPDAMLTSVHRHHTEASVKIATCARCDRQIYLVQTGKNTWHWTTENESEAKARRSMYCGNDPDYPLWTHAPAEQASA